MDLIEQVHIHGFTNIHTFEPNISLIRLFSLISIMQNPECLRSQLYHKANSYSQTAWVQEISNTVFHLQELMIPGIFSLNINKY